MSDKTDTIDTDCGHVRNVSATERLRALLDERGVEHFDGTESTLWGYESYDDDRGVYRYAADETSSGYMQVRLLRVTPEQAIAATLGRGTCELETNTDMTVIQCSKCGYVVPKGTDLMGVRYCAGCGRKVVNE